ncbi:MAG: hypothetical protein ABL901_19970 [Hyphomicrobiaceae bacterium]
MSYVRRLSFKHRIRLRRLAEKRATRRNRKSNNYRSAKRHTHLPLSGSSAVAPETKSATWRGSNYSVSVVGEAKAAPAMLCLDKNRDETLHFLSQVRAGLEAAASQFINRSRRRKAQHSPPASVGNYWDLSCVHEISPAVALMLAAEYERLHDHTGWRSSAIDVHKWDIDVFSLLEEIG